MTLYIYEEVKRYGEKTGNCTVCHKPMRQQKTFINTISPFNKDENGKIRDRQEIYIKLGHDVAQWQGEPMSHKKCKANGPT